MEGADKFQIVSCDAAVTSFLLHAISALTLDYMSPSHSRNMQVVIVIEQSQILK